MTLRRGFTLVETLVVAAVILLLLSLALPALSGGRSSARSAVSLSSVRTIGAALMSYAGDNRELPPLLFEPILQHWPDKPQRRDRGGVPVTGYWFDLRWQYARCILPPLPLETLIAPGSTQNYSGDIEGVRTAGLVEYWLTETLYASPEYWDRATQKGVWQWGPQLFSSVRFPSSKGMTLQTRVYGLPGKPWEQQTYNFEGIPGGVGWFDGSATTEIVSKLAPGEPNFDDPYMLTPPSYMDDGPSVLQTRAGVNGRDR